MTRRLILLLLIIASVILTVALIVINVPRSVQADGSNLLTGLQAWWCLNEESGTRYDAHGSNDLTDNNTVLYNTGVVSNAADFENDNAEYLSMADNADVSMGDISMTIASWVRLESLTVRRYLIAKNHDYYTRYDASTNRFVFKVSADGTNYTTVSANNYGSVPTDTWAFILSWHDPDTDKIFISVNDGSVNEVSHAGGIYNGSYAFSLGWRIGQAGCYMDGLMDSVALWKRTLTAAERTWLYNSGNGRAYSELGEPAATDTPTPTATDTDTHTPTDTSTPTPTDTSTPTPTDTSTPTTTPTYTATPTGTLTSTPVPSDYWTVPLPSGGTGTVTASITAGEAAIVIVLLALLFVFIYWFLRDHVIPWLQRG